MDPPTVAEAAAGGRRSSSRRRLWAALLALAIAVVGAIVLQGSAGPASLNREPHFFRGSVLPPVTPREPLEQAFTARANGLSGIVARVGTYVGATQCSINVVVSDPNGSVVGHRFIRCGNLADNALRLLIRFRPLPHSKGERFLVTVSAQPGARQAISLWGAQSGSSLPPAVSAGRLQPQSVALITEYGKRRPFVEIVGTALRRMAQYRVTWWRPPVVAGMMMAATLLLVALVAVPRRLSVAALLSLALIKGVFWTVAMPPLQGPDEDSHFAYAQFMAEEGGIPRRSTNVGNLPPYSDELRSADRLLHREADPPGNRPDFGPGARGADETRFTSGLSRRSGGNGSAAGYSPAYYAPASLLYRVTGSSIYTRISIMRLWSVALGLLSVWLALLIGRRLLPESEGAAVALALGVALQPMFSQQTAVINNDALVIAGSFLCLLVAMKLVEPGASRWMPLLGGLAVGATLLGKPFGLALAPVVAFGWLVGWLRNHPRTWKAWPFALARFGLGVGCTYGLWVMASVLFDYPAPSLSSLAPAPGSRSLTDYLHLMKLNNYQALKLDWVDRFWGHFAWVDLPLPGWVYSWLRWATLLFVVLVGVWLLHVVVVAVVRARKGRSLQPDQASVVPTLICLLAVASTVGVLHFIEFQGYLRTAKADIIQGRYGLMVLPAVVAMPALLLRRLIPRLPVIVSMVTVTSAIAVLHVLSLARIIDRFYL